MGQLPLVAQLLEQGTQLLELPGIELQQPELLQVLLNQAMGQLAITTQDPQCLERLEVGGEIGLADLAACLDIVGHAAHQHGIICAGGVVLTRSGSPLLTQLNAGLTVASVTPEGHQRRDHGSQGCPLAPVPVQAPEGLTQGCRAPSGRKAIAKKPQLARTPVMDRARRDIR